MVTSEWCPGGQAVPDKVYHPLNLHGVAHARCVQCGRAFRLSRRSRSYTTWGYELVIPRHKTRPRDAGAVRVAAALEERVGRQF